MAFFGPKAAVFAAMQATIEQKIRYGFGLGLGLLLFIAIVSYGSANKSVKTFRAAAHMDRVMDELEKLLLAMVDVETGCRGYVATGDEPFLEPYQTGRAKAEQSLQKLGTLVTDSTAQQARLEKLEPLIKGNIAY